MDSKIANYFVIKSDDTIEFALRKIEENNTQTVIVVDNAFKVIGTLTDGDIRKALITKRSLLAPVYDVMNTHFQWVSSHNKMHAHDIFSKYHYINLIPVLNDLGILHDIVLREN